MTKNENLVGFYDQLWIIYINLYKEVFVFFVSTNRDYMYVCENTGVTQRTLLRYAPYRA